MLSASVLEQFDEATKSWFEGAFSVPTPAQVAAWPIIGQRRNCLLLAPTGSGKTLAAFLESIDRLGKCQEAERAGVKVLYISPLKALGVDIQRNLRSPIVGIRATAERLGHPFREPTVGVRTGDTPAKERSRLNREPPDILITTPESLYLLLTSQARKILPSIDTVIIDEIHSLVGNKRGAHLFLSLERLVRLREHERPTATPLQRIGLSATQRPLEEIARLLGGAELRDGVPIGRDVEIVESGRTRQLDLTVEVPVEDMSRLAESLSPQEGDETQSAIPSIWPAIYPRLVERIRAHRSTMIFVNSRRLAERLATAINEVAEAELALAHHGSVAKETRLQIEDRLKRGDLPAIVATSSLELGIDMGAVDLVIQIEAPPSIASGIQRIGRAGHQVDAVSTGVIFPKFRGDLLACSAAVARMETGEVEATYYPRNPLDVLAQQITAMAALDTISVEEAFETVCRAAPFHDLQRSSFEGVLDLLSGRYPSDEFAELRPRIVWDRVSGTLSPRTGTQRTAILNAGTIPDRGLYGVYLATSSTSTRIGELDEEMVFETRPGEVFLLGASSWRVVDITNDRVLVEPAPGEPGRMPFWKGDGPGRPLEFGQAIGELSRALLDMPQEAAVNRLATKHGLDRQAASNLVDYLHEQIEAVGEIPSDRSIVIESFLDEIGDWRVAVLSPFGARVHAPWATAVGCRLRGELGNDMDMMWNDDGMLFRIPCVGESPPPAEWFVPDAEDVEKTLIDELGGTALFASRFRENAGRALLLPRKMPGRRTPLWLQRRRASDLLNVASNYPSFPILLETYRECLRDVFDLDGLRKILREISGRRISIHVRHTTSPSPFSRSLLFSYVGKFLYDGDAPLAERKAATLALDHQQLRELMGAADLRELFDADVIAELALELQRLDGRWPVRNVDDLHELLIRIGDLCESDVRSRMTEERRGELGNWLVKLNAERRVLSVGISGEPRLIAAEDASRFRDALGCMLPSGLPSAFLESVQDPVGDLVARYARTHAPFTADELATRLGLGLSMVKRKLSELAASDRVVSGEFTPGRQGIEWCDTGVLRKLKHRCLARLRQQVEPVAPEALGRFIVQWQSIESPRRGHDGVLDVLEQLQGLPLPYSIWETSILPARIRDFQPRLMDELCAAGEVIWRGHQSMAGNDGRIAFYLADDFAKLAPSPLEPDDPLDRTVLETLQQHGAHFFQDLVKTTDEFPPDVLRAVWNLVWAGWVTNDTLAPLRSARNSMDSRRGEARSFRSRRKQNKAGGEGRWGVLANIQTTPTEQAVAISRQLISRYGVLCREMLTVEAVPGGFARLYPVLRDMEESGKLRRGYFVEGMGGAQFATPGAEDRLRQFRDLPAGGQEPFSVVLAALDPANPYGTVLPWPSTGGAGNGPAGRPQRATGAHVFLRDGAVIAYLNKSATQVLTFGAVQENDRRRQQWIAEMLVAHATAKGPLTLRKVDETAILESALAEPLKVAGFRPTVGGLYHRGFVEATAKRRPAIGRFLGEGEDA